MDEIFEIMLNHYYQKRFLARRLFKFWSSLNKKPGETIHESAALTRQDATTCNFSSNKDSQMRQWEHWPSQRNRSSIRDRGCSSISRETIYWWKHQSWNHFLAVKKHQDKTTTTHNSEPNLASSPSSTCMRCGDVNCKSSVCR